MPRVESPRDFDQPPPRPCGEDPVAGVGRHPVHADGHHLGLQLPLHEGRARGALARPGGVVPPAARRAHPRPLRRAATRQAPPQHPDLGAHDACSRSRSASCRSCSSRGLSSTSHPGLASIYNATTPIMTAIMAGLLFRVEKLKAVQIAGILVGILGVMVIIAPWQGLDFSQSLVAQLAILGATACYGFSLAYMRKFVAEHRHERARLLVPQHRHRGGDHGAADTGARAHAGTARPVDRRQHRAARMPRHGCRVHLEPERPASVGSDTRVDRHLHHAGGRGGCSASWCSARACRGTSRSVPSSSSSASCSRRTGCAGVPPRAPPTRPRSGADAAEATSGCRGIRPLRTGGQSCCSAPCRSSVMVTSLPTSTPPVSSAAFQVRPKSSRLMTVVAVAPAL